MAGFRLVASATILLAAACSRNVGPATETVQPSPPPVAKEDRAPGREPSGVAQKPKLRLAAAVEDNDAGVIAAAPSLNGKTILHVGDSMVGGDWGLTKALEKKFLAEGAKFVHQTTVSESIVSFDKSSKLKELFAKVKPDVVILTLGTNDVFVPYPNALAPNVQSIARRMGGRECYWMGPPLWKPDTGVVAVIKDNADPCKFFDASSLKLARGKDGIHPTDQGGSEWADQFWEFYRGGVPASTAPFQTDFADAGH